jgi:hypothetical protein
MSHNFTRLAPGLYRDETERFIIVRRVGYDVVDVLSEVETFCVDSLCEAEDWLADIFAPRCLDCTTDEPVTDWYMVVEAVWQETGLASDGGCLCINHLEARIGRELIAADLADLPINNPQHYQDEPDTNPRLIALKLELNGATA